MLLLEGVQAGGKEEEGEGSERGSHLRVQDGAQDGVHRSEGEEVKRVLLVSITPLCSMQYLAICNRVLFAHYKCILFVLLGASQGERVQGVQEARVQGDHQAGVQDCS